MAERVTVELIDDIDQSKADEHIVFAVGAQAYEIDLSSKNATAFQKALKPYIDAARPAARAAAAPGRPAGAARKRSGAAAAGVNLTELREWAAANNVEVPKRGRIPKAIIDQYTTATKG